MVLPNSLFDNKQMLVLDASVLINLIATERAMQILDALPNKIVVTEVAATEVDAGKSKRNPDMDELANLVCARKIERVELPVEAENYFLELVGGKGISTLDDGEAATIAWSVTHQAIPVLDDKKAIKVCCGRFPHIQTASTLDIFAQSYVVNELGDDALSDAVYSALKFARMRVPNEYLSWVLETIGLDKAKTCSSLPAKIRNSLEV